MRKAILAAIMAVVAAGAAHAQVSEAEQRQACEADAMALCSAEIPDRQRIGQCLRAKRQQISADCRTVLDGGRPARRQ